MRGGGVSIKSVNIPHTITVACCHLYDLTVLSCKILYLESSLLTLHIHCIIFINTMIQKKKQEIEIEFETSLQCKYFKNTNFNLKQSFWHVIVG